jgi:hypothetical protein
MLLTLADGRQSGRKQQNDCTGHRGGASVNGLYCDTRAAHGNAAQRRLRGMMGQWLLKQPRNKIALARLAIGSSARDPSPEGRRQAARLRANDLRASAALA